jgi:molecular chaperone HscB
MLDEGKLRQAFLRNSKQYHPDFHTLANSEQQADMLELATLNNEAYKTLSNLDERIRYVLSLKGLVGNENQLPDLPQDFLMDMMDINEQIMEMEFVGSNTLYDTLLNSVQNIENELFEGVKPILDSYNDATATTDELKKVQNFFLKKRYLLRILENLRKFAPA